LTDTRNELLDRGQALAQRHGYNGFSFSDLAVEIGIKTASIHYHFPTKADLGKALMARYRERFMARLAIIDLEQSDARRKLEQFAGLFEETLAAGGKLCLCGMLASEYETLPDLVRVEVRAFFDACELWLVNVLKQGRAAKLFNFAGSGMETAQMLLSSLEGAMVTARTFGDMRRLTNARHWLLDAIAGASATSRGSARAGQRTSSRKRR